MRLIAFNKYQYNQCMGYIALFMILLVSSTFNMYAQNSRGGVSSPTKGMENGHEWVDLGLPSGTLWATCNVGASKPEGLGDYFAWGEIKPKEIFKIDNAEILKNVDFEWLAQNGYLREGARLSLPHDAARQNWGGSWRLPTTGEIFEVTDKRYTDYKWTTINGVIGQLITSKSNGNSIFLPAAGFKVDSLYKFGVEGQYLSSDPVGGNTRLVFSFLVSQYRLDVNTNMRFTGFTVRPVRKKDENKEKLITGNEPNTKGVINGHEWVDLGLPSGTKWATCNVGASKPEEYGDYFAWGETSPKLTYTTENSKPSYKDNEWLYNNGFIGKDGNLNLSHDAARQNWGGSWRMPTKEELDELKSNTIVQWVERNGVKGKLLLSERNGNCIFIPAAGYHIQSSFDGDGENGGFWSSTPDEVYTGSAFNLSFEKNKIFYKNEFRGKGISVRPVSD